MDKLLMEQWFIWLILGLVMSLLEFIVPGGVIVFLGASAIVVSASMYFGLISTTVNALLAWFICSIFFMIFLRSLFIKYFEGDSTVHNIDEENELVDSLVTVIEDIQPYKEGRAKFRDSTWVARSDETILAGDRAVIVRSDGNILILKSL